VTGQRSRDARPEVMDALELIPDDGWISEHDLADAASATGTIEVIRGGIRGIRSLRRAGAIILREHDDGVVRLARTPKGTSLLEAHRAGHRRERA